MYSQRGGSWRTTTRRTRSSGGEEGEGRFRGPMRDRQATVECWRSVWRAPPDSSLTRDRISALCPRSVGRGPRPWRSPATREHSARVRWSRFRGTRLSRVTAVSGRKRILSSRLATRRTRSRPPPGKCPLFVATRDKHPGMVRRKRRYLPFKRFVSDLFVDLFVIPSAGLFLCVFLSSAKEIRANSTNNIMQFG